ncbi:hypothetical protein MMC28_006079 [Mycoblastus sanguinarius]|nr:hypothetical protein [Mycoblastus sanguinarius]
MASRSPTKIDSLPAFAMKQKISAVTAAATTTIPLNPPAATPLSRNTSTAFFPFQSSSTPLPSTPGPEPSHHLSQGAHTAINVVASICFTLIIVLFILYFASQKRRRTRLATHQSNCPWIKTELSAEDADSEDRAYNFQIFESAPIAELDGDSTSGIYELPGKELEMHEAPGDLSTLPQLMARLYDTL